MLITKWDQTLKRVKLEFYYSFRRTKSIGLRWYRSTIIFNACRRKNIFAKFSLTMLDMGKYEEILSLVRCRMFNDL